MKTPVDDFRLFSRFLITYARRKVVRYAHKIERSKNKTVDILMVRRGILQQRVWHTSMIGLSAVGLITSGVIGGQSVITASFPGAEGQDPRFAQVYEPNNTSDPVLNSFSDTHTNTSDIRSRTIEYEVKSGDTLSTIAQKFKISNDTIKWANKLDNVHTIKPGQKLLILPVTGVEHQVKAGDTLESIAKKYSADQQAIAEYPFNDISDDLKLKVGELVIVPEGVIEPEKKPNPRLPQFIADSKSSPSQAFSAPGGGNFIWPARGVLTQYFAWYHPGSDIANSSAPPVVASDGGTVVVAGWPDNYGYGNRVVIDHGNGYRTLYAHLSNIYVTVGSTVSQGQVLGQMGSTGRSTGTHLHFEIRYKGIAVNPLAILK